MKVYVLCQITIAALAMLILSGCMGSTGWRFEIGVSPVKQLDNRAGLSQEAEKPVSKGDRY